MQRRVLEWRRGRVVCTASSGCQRSRFDGDGARIRWREAHALRVKGISYLGCLSCSQYDMDSVFNQYGSHGSRYQTDSIFNPYGELGSKYSNYGACSPYATDPPVIVDGSGTFFGKLTVNRYGTQGASAEWVAWIGGVCAGR